MRSAEKIEAVLVTHRGILPLPFKVANGSRIYAADGEEVAVATKASARHRRAASDTAAYIVRAVNAHRLLVDALRAAEEWMLTGWIEVQRERGDSHKQALRGLKETPQHAIHAVRAALRLATGDTNA